jgi:hypothetical protein
VRTIRSPWVLVVLVAVFVAVLVVLAGEFHWPWQT